MGLPKLTGYQFVHRPSDGQYSSIHVWSNKSNDTLCPTPQYIFTTDDYVKTASPPEYGSMCPVCQRIISGRATQNNKPKNTRKPKMAPVRPGEAEYLKRWNGVINQHPSLWEKMDRDPVYERAVHSRGISDGGDNTSMGTKWGVGRPRGSN
jgi:hypothetical protein